MANRIKESNITPGAVTSDKIAPGTVSASNISPGSITTTQIATDTIASSNIAPGTIANDRLANNSVTINGSSVSLGGSVDISAGTDWQSVVTADGSTATTASAGEGYFIDTTSNAHTINLPSSPSQGDEVTIVDYAGTFGTNNVTVGRNGSNIDGTATDGTLATNRLNVRFVYIDATQGWKAIFDDVTASYGAGYITATGGTVTESGDFKIHTFTGDGCFVVSCAGNPAGSNTVDYLVVAGGGGGGGSHNSPDARAGGGGGAGGYRESSGAASGCYSVSPLGACVSALPVSATTYPITVGAGGVAGDRGASTGGGNGNNSIFSTITSTAGGGGGTAIGGPVGLSGCGADGGSGGGGSGGGVGTNVLKGSGNTPPVSPAQGTDGGCGSNPAGGSGGGGGATVVGSNASGPDGGGGGAGATTSISGSPTAYAGGGGGAGGSGGGGTGGPGGGGAGGGTGVAGTAGTTNTGGAGGGAGFGPQSSPNSIGGAGGKGIVIIRYKFQ